MNLSDPEILELNELCSALVDGAITETQRTRLNQVLRESDAARQFYARYAGLSASLISYAGEMQSERPDRVLRSGKNLWWMALLAGTAAAVVAGAVTLWLSRPGDSSQSDPDQVVTEQEEDVLVARLTGARDCEWSGRANALKVGDHLRRGERLELARGAAEITFDSGAQVLLEAATDLEVNSAWAATLHHGTLKTSAPAQAVGFRIVGPTVDVVDLGTDFSMVAERGKMTEVYVLKGSVEATPRDETGGNQGRVVLKEHQARRFGLREVSEIRDKEQKIARFKQRVELDRRFPPGGCAHWTFDETGGSVAKAEVQGIPAGNLDAVLESSDETIASLWAEGHVQRALSLDGKSCARAVFPGISANTPHTVAFWVNVPADADLSESSAMISWGVKKHATEPVQIGWNRNPGQGVLGALRTELGKRSVVGTTPLRDGQWHHVAVVFIPLDGDTAATQVKQYVDGRLEGSTGKRSRKHRSAAGTDVDESVADVVWIGSHVMGPRQGRELLRGKLDELFIVEGALTPREIVQLIGENKVGRVGRIP